MGLRKIGEEMHMETDPPPRGGPAERKRVAGARHEGAALPRAARPGPRRRRAERRSRRRRGESPDLEPLAREHGIPFFWTPSADKAAHEEFLLARLAEQKPDFVSSRATCRS
jgi:hypothetical protein